MECVGEPTPLRFPCAPPWLQSTRSGWADGIKPRVPWRAWLFEKTSEALRAPSVCPPALAPRRLQPKPSSPSTGSCRMIRLLFLQEPPNDFSKIKVHLFQGRTERIQLKEAVTLYRQRTGTNCLWATTRDQWQLNIWLLSLSISLISLSHTLGCLTGIFPLELCNIRCSLEIQPDREDLNSEISLSHLAKTWVLNWIWDPITN